MSPPPLPFWSPGDWPLLLRLLLPLAIILCLIMLLRRTLSDGIYSDSLVRNTDIVGQVGVIILSCGPRKRGLVRLTVKGNLLDLPACSDGRILALHESVIVLHQLQDHLLVVPLQQVFTPSQQKPRAQDQTLLP
jgi:hypothetical protein